MTDDELIEKLYLAANGLWIRSMNTEAIALAIDRIRQAAIGDEAIQALVILIEAKDMVVGGPEGTWSARRYAELKTEGWARARAVLAKVKGKES